MAVGTSSSIVHIGNIIPAGTVDLAGSSTTPQTRGGVYSFTQDAFGTMRIFRYVYNTNATTMLRNELMSRAANVAVTGDDATAGVHSTLSIADVAAFTADNEIGALCIMDEAGDAAPQGETGIVVGNSADQLDFDVSYPLSAAPADADTAVVWHPFTGDDAADGDLAINVHGVIMADIATRSYGWAQCYGFHPSVLDVAAQDNTAGDPAVAAAAGVGVFGSDAESLWVGWFPTTIGTTQTHVPVFLELFHQAQPVA